MELAPFWFRWVSSQFLIAGFAYVVMRALGLVAR